MPRIALVPGLRAGRTAGWLLQMGQLTRILAYETGRNRIQSLIKDNAYCCLLFTCTRMATVCPAELWSFVPCCRISPRSGACTGCHKEDWVSVFFYETRNKSLTSEGYKLKGGVAYTLVSGAKAPYRHHESLTLPSMVRTLPPVIRTS